MSGSTRSIRSSFTVTKRLLLAACCVAGAALTASAQNIRSHYVSKAETDGVIYHTFPVTLFESPQTGDLTFDITYKEHRGGRATINFSCGGAGRSGRFGAFRVGTVGDGGPCGETIPRTGEERVETPLYFRCRRFAALRIFRRGGRARSDALCRGTALRLPGQAFGVAQLRAGRVPRYSR